MSTLRISPKGLDEIKQSEALRLEAYQDVKGVWTIGYGHTGKVNGKPIRAGMKITPEQAEQILLDDTAHFEKAVRDNVKVPLNQNQYDALVSLSFNIGDGAFKNSTLLRRLNQGDYQAAADQMLVWNKSGGKFVQGLLNRRERERAMFLNNNKPIDPQMPMPTEFDEPIDHRPTLSPTQMEQITEPTPPLETAQPSAVPPQIGFQQMKPIDFAITANEPETMLEEPESPNYQEGLAKAFGIMPKANNGLGDYVGELVKSIYDQA